MKKETVVWVLIVGLIIGQSILFTLHFSKCQKNKKWHHGKKNYSKQWDSKRHHDKMFQELCDSCRTKVKKSYN